MSSGSNVPSLDQSPPFIITQPDYTPQSAGAHGSVAPVVAVLVAVAVLGVVAAVVGRLCTGKRIMGYGHKYDMESWAEAKCSSCIDGRIHVAAPRQPTNQAQGDQETMPQQSDQHSLRNEPSN